MFVVGRIRLSRAYLRSIMTSQSSPPASVIDGTALALYVHWSLHSLLFIDLDLSGRFAKMSLSESNQPRLFFLVSSLY